MKIKLIKDMKLGVYGLDEELIEKLKDVFAKVEIVALSKFNHYDALYFDITNGTEQMYQYIAKQSPIPLIVQTKDEDSFKQLGFLPHYSYMILTAGDDKITAQEIRQFFRGYLDRFEGALRHFHMYYDLIPGMKLEDRIELSDRVKSDRRKKLIQQGGKVLMECEDTNSKMETDDLKDAIENASNICGHAMGLVFGNGFREQEAKETEPVEIVNPRAFSTKEEKKAEIWKEWMVKRGKMDRKELKVFAIYD